jgi:hypothetical protein
VNVDGCTSLDLPLHLDPSNLHAPARLCQPTASGRDARRPRDNRKSQRKSHSTSVRRTRLVAAAPDCGFIYCTARHQIKAERAVGTWGLVCSVFSLAVNYRVVTTFHVVALIATGHRAGKAVIRLRKKPSRMSRFLSGDHWKIVVKTQWKDVERHFQFRCM